MQPEAREEARDWLIRAERDLLIGHRALQGEPALAEQSAYHAQQAAEKALKAFLAAQGVPFPKSHDLVRLVSLCTSVDVGFDRFIPTAQVLNPYATEFRYPGGLLEPELSEAEEAIRLAQKIVDDVRQIVTQSAE